jgi:hypothetical protein
MEHNSFLSTQITVVKVSYKQFHNIKMQNYAHENQKEDNLLLTSMLHQTPYATFRIQSHYDRKPVFKLILNVKNTLSL